MPRTIYEHRSHGATYLPSSRNHRFRVRTASIPHDKPKTFLTPVQRNIGPMPFERRFRALREAKMQVIYKPAIVARICFNASPRRRQPFVNFSATT
ncbi:hypothetical protein KCP78_07320 [Salmonella enterica subsp. enterica]|nr:hypothetical protein KCP78_07320 [Salmonella enterica subsp. enterica]